MFSLGVTKANFTTGRVIFPCGVFRTHERALPSGPVKVSMIRPSGQMPRGVKSSSFHTRSPVLMISSGCEHFVRRMSFGACILFQQSAPKAIHLLLHQSPRLTGWLFTEDRWGCVQKWSAKKKMVWSQREVDRDITVHLRRWSSIQRSFGFSDDCDEEISIEACRSKIEKENSFNHLNESVPHTIDEQKEGSFSSWYFDHVSSLLSLYQMTVALYATAFSLRWIMSRCPRVVVVASLGVRWTCEELSRNCPLWGFLLFLSFHSTSSKAREQADISSLMNFRQYEKIQCSLYRQFWMGKGFHLDPESEWREDPTWSRWAL